MKIFCFFLFFFPFYFRNCACPIVSYVLLRVFRPLDGRGAVAPLAINAPSLLSGKFDGPCRDVPDYLGEL